MNLLYKDNFNKFFKILLKIIILPFTLILFLLFPQAFASGTIQNEYYSNYTTNSGSLYFSGIRIFNDLDYKTLHTGGDDLKDIKELLYQIFLLLLITNFFILIYIFYIFKNDLLGKH